MPSLLESTLYYTESCSIMCFEGVSKAGSTDISEYMRRPGHRQLQSFAKGCNTGCHESTVSMLSLFRFCY